MIDTYDLVDHRQKIKTFKDKPNRMDVLVPKKRDIAYISMATEGTCYGNFFFLSEKNLKKYNAKQCCAVACDENSLKKFSDIFHRQPISSIIMREVVSLRVFLKLENDSLYNILNTLLL